MADWKHPRRLFIPGPVKVRDDVLQQLARPTLGHRTQAYMQLHGETVQLLKRMLFTDQHVFLSTPSGSGFRAAATRHSVAPDATVLFTCAAALSY